MLCPDVWISSIECRMYLMCKGGSGSYGHCSMEKCAAMGFPLARQEC